MIKKLRNQPYTPKVGAGGRKNVEDKLENECGANSTFSTLNYGTAATQNLRHSTSRGNRLRCHSAD
jgi:hypothetical protein